MAKLSELPQVSLALLSCTFLLLLVVFHQSQGKSARNKAWIPPWIEPCVFSQFGHCVFFSRLQVYLFPVSIQSNHTEEHYRNRGLIRVSTSITFSLVSIVKIQNNDQHTVPVSGTVEILYMQYDTFSKEPFNLVHCVPWHLESIVEHIPTSYMKVFSKTALGIHHTFHRPWSFNLQ